MPGSHIVVCAGETSGDNLAAGMMRSLSERRADLRFTGMGGEAMRAAGADTLIDVSELAVMGLWEVITQYPRLRGLLRRMQRHLEETQPALLVLVDYVEFNLRLGAYARDLGIPVLFYVSPQIWAWRQKRIHRIKRSVDAMAVLFPFETRIYQEHGIPVRYVGNPLADQLPPPPGALRAELSIPDGTRLLGLLPGSRRGEIQRHWPLLVATAHCLQRRQKALHFLVPLAPGIRRETLDALAPVTDLPMTLLTGPGRAREVMAASDLLLISSGTATLEAALLQTPMIVIYKMAPLSFALFSRLVRVPHVALANIVGGGALVPERLQRDANPQALCREALELLGDPARLTAMRDSLGQVRACLGPGDASRRAAEAVLELLRTGQLGPEPEAARVNP